MAWTLPKTWVKGELFTAVLANLHIRDNLNALRSGSIATQGGNYLVYASSASQVASLAPQSGKIPRFNGLTNQWEMVHPLEVHWPIGIVYKSVVATNPNTLLGFGTWVSFGSSRLTVGLDAGDPDFSVVQQTGGAKTHTLTQAELPAHSHTQDPHNHTQDSHNHLQNAHSHDLTNFGSTANVIDFTSPTVVDNAGTKTTSSETATNIAATAVNQSTIATNQNTGGGGSHSNVMPYIVMYRWVRTA